MKRGKMPIYGGTLYLYTSHKRMQKARDWFKLGSNVNVLSAGHTVQYVGEKNGESHYLMGVFDGLQQTLVHEVGHVTLNVCAHVGINPHESASEPFCYLLDYIYTSLKDHI